MRPIINIVFVYLVLLSYSAVGQDVSEQQVEEVLELNVKAVQEQQVEEEPAQQVKKVLRQNVKEVLRQNVKEVLDSFHQAAANADSDTYFSLLSDEAVFLGTDATERWNKAQFLGFAKPYFSKGKGWTYLPRDRHVNFSAGRQVAWFDELLDSEKYGECRGTGVLELVDGKWLISQYHLTIPVPNALAAEMAEHISKLKGEGENE